MVRAQLSKADTKVLAHVFDPESAPTRSEILVDPALPQDCHILDSVLLSYLKAQEKEAISLIERCESSYNISKSKDEAYRKALSILNKLVNEYPDYASARNNRAQLRRWRFGDRHLLCQEKATSDPERIAAGVATTKDLETAVKLASPERPTDAVSPAQGRILAQSYTQLGALYHAACKDLQSPNTAEIASPDFEDWSKDRFEDEASRLFYLGGLFGNEVAKVLAVHTNPHAKLCGNIVKEAMRKEFAAALG